MKQPPSVVFLAAELAACGVPAPRAAFIADKLCRYGRTFNRISEKLGGGEKEWGRWSDKVEQLQDRAHKRLDRLEHLCNQELVGFGRCKVVRGALHLSALCGIHETSLL